MLRLPFMVDPDQLKKHTYVQDHVWVIITDPSHDLYKPYLGKSGKLLAGARFRFCFEKDIANHLIQNNVAELD